MKYKPLILLILLSILAIFTWGQNPMNVDSIADVIENTKVDSTKIRLMNDFAWNIRYSNAELSEKYSKETLTLAQKTSNALGEGMALAILGNLQKNQGQMEQALDYYNQAIKVYEESSNNKGLGDVNNYIGIVYAIQANYPKTLEYWKKAHDFYKKAGNKKGGASVLGNIGVVYDNLGDYETSLEYYLDALKIHETLPDNKTSIAAGYNNIGLIHSHVKNYDLALDFQHKALSIRKEISDINGLGDSYLNLAEIFKLKANQDSSLFYIENALDAYKKVGNKKGIASALLQKNDLLTQEGNFSYSLPILEECLTLYNEIGDQYGHALTTEALGMAYMRKGDFNEAKINFEKAKEVFAQLGMKSMVGNVLKNMADNEFKMGNGTKAYQYMRSYALLNDSLISEESTKQVAQMQTIYESEKKQLEIENLNNKNGLNEMLIKQQKQQKYVLYVGLLFVFLIALFVYNRLQITRKQKNIIEEQKEEVETQRDQIESQKQLIEEKHTQITESITYAKRIQTAILPPHELIQKYLPNSFIFYQPKEVVAGDFYWLEVIDDNMYLAAADCTGHGVPGAMVSVVCHSALNRSVREYKLLKPSEILDKTRELVISTFEKSKEQVKDGMDISLIKLNFKNQTAEWAGANNPLYIIQNDTIEIIKGDRQPIGYSEAPTLFTNHVIEWKEESQIYLFSDGYADQFGGAEGKKIGYKNFREQLLSVSKENIDHQKDVLHSYFQKWKGNGEQIDDVCLIGVKI